MKTILFIFLAALGSLPATAHPGIGIVQDQQGNIFYTDLEQVWQIAPNGATTVAVANVHTHQLYIDAHDNLYGEHLWYEGEATDKWGHYYWRRSPTGRLDTVVGPMEGFADDHSLYRDSLGNEYWLQRWQVSRIKKKSPDGTVTVVAEKALHHPGWMHVTPGGHIYLADGSDIYYVSPRGEWRLLAAHITGEPTGGLDVLGLWPDAAGNVYVADTKNRQVKKISAAGIVTTIFTSNDAFTIAGGLFDPHGDLWLLQYNPANEVRVKKVAATALTAHPPAQHSAGFLQWIFVLPIIAVVLVGAVGFVLLRRRRNIAD